MSVLVAERIKFLSTRSPYWTAGSAVVLVVGLSVLLAALTDLVTEEQDILVAPADIVGPIQQLGLAVVLVMATLAVTTEYRFGTIRSTFLAVSDRRVALLAKAVVVATAGALVGLVASFLSWVLTAVILGSDLLPATGAEWRLVAGSGAAFALGSVIAVAVGILLRHTAGAVSLLLIWMLVVESLVGILPRIGEDIARWLPFNVLGNFLGAQAGAAPEASWSPFASPVASLVYVAVFATVLFAVALAVADRRDA